MEPRVDQNSQQMSPDPIFQMVIGYWVSKTLMTAVEIDIFTKISTSGKPVTIGEIQSITGLEKRPGEVFVTALISLGLIKVTKDNNKGNEQNHQNLYSNTGISETFLNKSKTSYIGDFVIAMDKQFYKRWDNLLQSLEANKPLDNTGNGSDDNSASSSKSIFEKARSDQFVQQLQMFTHAMYGVSVAPAMALSKKFDFSNYKKMMDIGGGSGVYTIEVVKQNPHMSAIVLDLKSACQVANQYIKQSGLGGKIETKVFDFFRDDFPKDCNIAFLSHIVHQYGKETNTRLLKKIYDSLPSNSAIIISEWFLNNEKTGPTPSALLGLLMIIEHDEGRNYSYSEVSEILEDAGFTNIEKKELPGPADVLIGYKTDK